MNRVKKELRRRGICLSYPWLPYDNGSYTVEDVTVDSSTATVTIDTVSITFRMAMQRSGELIDVD